MTSTRFLIDTNAFVSAKRLHYGFDFCPGFWKALLSAHEQKRVFSVVPVRDELLKSNDDLTEWVKDSAPTSFFKGVGDKAVQAAYASISQFVASGSFKDSEKAKFLSGADPWLVAFANVNHFVIVTYEVSAGESKAKVKIPDVANEFGVSCQPPYQMLRDLKVRLKLGSNSFN